MKNNVEGFTNRTVINQEAAQWILLLEETPELSPEQVRALNEWVATSEVHRECIEAMAVSWSEMDLLTSVMLPQEMYDKPAAASGFLRRLQTSLVWLYARVKQSRKPLYFASAASALLLVVGIVSTSLMQPQINVEATVMQTNVGESVTHNMPDGSVLWLNSNSHIRVHYADTHRRIFLLKGEAHFEVAKDASRPFEVYANDKLIKAIGTAFSVHKLDDSIEVLVSEGTVELAVVDSALVMIPDDLQSGANKLINNTSRENQKTSEQVQATVPNAGKKVLRKLTAGQRISIPVKSNVVEHVDELDPSEMTRSLSWREGKLVFAGESLEEVIQEITRHTEVKIEVVDPKLKSIRIGGQFQVGETDSLFYVLESGFGIRVNRVNEHHVKLYIK